MDKKGGIKRKETFNTACQKKQEKKRGRKRKETFNTACQKKQKRKNAEH